MRVTDRVREILSYYESDSPGTKTNLCRVLMSGRLGGTGRIIILPVDQGFEHGPAQSFAPNPPAYDPFYLFDLAIDCSLSAYAAPLGLLEAGAASYAGAIPTILKLNNSNTLIPKAQFKDQAVTGTVTDALRLGCVAVGMTVYPGAPKYLDLLEEAREIIAEAKSRGLASVIWSYPRDGDFGAENETAIDVVAYSVHMAALLGAHIIKVKFPSERIGLKATQSVYEALNVQDPVARTKHIMQTAFNGRRIVLFSGGAKKGDAALFDEARAIKAGGANGSIIGRNSFQRSRQEAKAFLSELASIYS